MASIADQTQRQQALNPCQSFAVAAPAGSGKTGLLTQRVLQLLMTVESPEEILCLTFTRKAAGEMQQRVLEALELAMQPEPEEEFQKQTWQLGKAVLQRDAEKNWQLALSPGRLRITTIDSFCRNLALQLGPDSGISEGMETREAPNHLYQDAISDVIMSFLDNQDAIGKAVRSLLIHQQNDLTKLIELLQSLLAKREQWLEHVYETRGARSRLESYLQQTIRSALYRARQHLLPVGGELAMLADYAANNLAANQSPPTKEDINKQPVLACLGLSTLPDPGDEKLDLQTMVDQWQGLTHLLMTKAASPGWRSPRGIDKRMGFPTARDNPECGAVRKEQLIGLLEWCTQQSGLLETLQDIRHLPAPNYPDNQWQVLEALATLLPVLAAQLRIVFQQHNQCDYSEVVLAASRALGDNEQPTDLALKLDYQIKHILIDEFQDTSTIQYRLLAGLTRGWEPDDGRTLFIVGDGMQSLYGFRNANVGLFLEARSMPLGAIQMTPLDLSSNFRSQQGIIQWTNEVFAKSFPQQDNMNRGAVRYSPAAAIKPALDDLAVTIDGFHDYSHNQEEARRVLHYIQSAKQQDPEQSIAVLVRDRGQLKHLLPVLRDAGLSWTARDIEPIAQQMAVIDLLSLTKALLEPTDRIAWLSVLRAPWCGLTLKDLYHLTNTPIPTQTAESGRQRQPYPLLISQLFQHQQIQTLSQQAQNRLATVAPLLLKSWEQRGRKPFRVAVEGLWRALGGDIISRQFGQYTSCLSLLNLIEQHESSHTLPDWEIFTQAVNRLYAEPDANADPHLEIMTIHKSKGLEFDTVIMPGLNRKSASGDKPLMLWRETISDQGQPQLIISPREPSTESSDVIFQHLKQETKHREHLENVRVMYVGATRAIKRLHLLYSASTGKSGVKVTNGSLLDAIWPWFSEKQLSESEQHPSVTIHCCPGADNEKASDKSPQIKTQLLRLEPLPQPATPAGTENTPASDRFQPVIKTSGEAIDFDEPSKPNDQGSAARITGTLLHRIIRQITLDGISTWQNTQLTDRHPFWKLQLQAAGSDDIEGNLQRLDMAVATLLEDTSNHWIFDNSHSRSATELAISYQDLKGVVRKAMIDRTFIWHGGNASAEADCRWIIDYKLSQPTEGEPAAHFFKRQAEQYWSQLQFYAQLMRHHGPESIRAGLYFPLLGHFEEIHLGSA